MREAIERICRDAGWDLSGDRVTVPLAGDRRQVVGIDEYEAGGISFVRLFSRLGEAERVDERRLRAALRLSWTLPYGAVAIASLDESDPETLLLCDSVPRDDIPAAPERVRATIQHLAETADNYEKFVFGTDDH